MWRSSTARGAFHIDVETKTLRFWLAAPESNPEARAKNALSEEAMLTEAVIRLLVRSMDRNRGESAQEVADLLSKHRESVVEINPAALVNAPQSAPIDERLRILHLARRSVLDIR